MSPHEQSIQGKGGEQLVLKGAQMLEVYFSEKAGSFRRVGTEGQVNTKQLSWGCRKEYAQSSRVNAGGLSGGERGGELSTTNCRKRLYLTDSLDAKRGVGFFQ